MTDMWNDMGDRKRDLRHVRLKRRSLRGQGQRSSHAQNWEVVNCIFTPSSLHILLLWVLMLSVLF